MKDHGEFKRERKEGKGKRKREMKSKLCRENHRGKKDESMTRSVIQDPEEEVNVIKMQFNKRLRRLGPLNEYQ